LKTELDILRDLSKRLDSAGIGYMVTGSVAMLHSHEMTRDIDVVMDLRESDAETLTNLFIQDYYIDREQLFARSPRDQFLTSSIKNSVIKVDRS
jgi:hypothetical protein